MPYGEKGKSINRSRVFYVSRVEPLEVAKTFKKLGFNELYVADLDAITDGSSIFKFSKISPRKLDLN